MRLTHRVWLPIVATLALAFAAPLPAHAQQDTAAQRAARWKALEQAVFGTRPVMDGAGIIALKAPERALDAALVPITVTLSGNKPIKAVYLVIDGNPSPLAGTFHFGPASVPHQLKTRVRVEQYTLMHAVAETTDGGLYVATRYVKAAGGCSAPMGENQAQAMKHIGRMKLRLFGAVQPGKASTAELLIWHPNNNGMQMDQITHYYIPARFIENITVTEGGRLVFSLDSDISLSSNPAITFGFMPLKGMPLKVVVKDSTHAVFRHSFPVEDGGA